MKGAIVYSNFSTTVSPEHAREATGSDQGMGLGHTLHIHQAKFGGVLNGIDYEVWNPEIDILIPSKYTAGTIEQKYANKDALRDRLLLRKDYKPVIAYVGRIDRQKGAHLIHHAIFYALAQGAQFVLLACSADPADNGHFWHLKHYLNDNPDCHLEIGFDEGLAHLIYAGADTMVMPSLFEPCGLSQMIALKYGTVPIVRATGGLVNTIFDRDYSARHPVEPERVRVPPAGQPGAGVGDGTRRARLELVERAGRAHQADDVSSQSVPGGTPVPG